MSGAAARTRLREAMLFELRRVSGLVAHNALNDTVRIVGETHSQQRYRAPPRAGRWPLDPTKLPPPRPHTSIRQAVPASVQPQPVRTTHPAKPVPSLDVSEHLRDHLVAALRCVVDSETRLRPPQANWSTVLADPAAMSPREVDAMMRLGHLAQRADEAVHNDSIDPWVFEKNETVGRIANQTTAMAIRILHTVSTTRHAIAGDREFSLAADPEHLFTAAHLAGVPENVIINARRRLRGLTRVPDKVGRFFIARKEARQAAQRAALDASGIGAVLAAQIEAQLEAQQAARRQAAANEPPVLQPPTQTPTQLRTQTPR
ncbi:hypothetical protein BC831DRAFT_443233 [Entophlyctis helioformis]|nr:hypothetical protein BC831DRAFT_443233 [Entophlyctis helioformis]